MREKRRLNISTPAIRKRFTEFFGELCTDSDYVEPALLEIGPEVEVPE